MIQRRKSYMTPCLKIIWILNESILRIRLMFDDVSSILKASLSIIGLVLVLEKLMCFSSDASYPDSFFMT